MRVSADLLFQSKSENAKLQQWTLKYFNSVSFSLKMTFVAIKGLRLNAIRSYALVNGMAMKLGFMA